MSQTDDDARDDRMFQIAEDLRITKTTRRAAGAGTWVCGTTMGHRFDCLAFPEHAENPDYEMDDSRRHAAQQYHADDGHLRALVPRTGSRHGSPTA